MDIVIAIFVGLCAFFLGTKYGSIKASERLEKILDRKVESAYQQGLKIGVGEGKKAAFDEIERRLGTSSFDIEQGEQYWRAAQWEQRDHSK